MKPRWLDWSWASIVMVLTAVLVVLDVTDGPVHRYWSRHSFTSSVLAGLLVLLLTIVMIDRVTRIRQLRNQSQAIAAQAAVILVQAGRTADAIGASRSAEDRESGRGGFTHLYADAAHQFPDTDRGPVRRRGVAVASSGGADSCPR